MTARELAAAIIKQLDGTPRLGRPKEFLRAQPNGQVADEVIVELHDADEPDGPVQSFVITVEEAD